MNKVLMLGTPSLLDWVLGAQEREGVREIPSKYFVPRVAGDEALCKISPDATKLLCCAEACKLEMDRLERSVNEQASSEAQRRFERSKKRVINPAFTALNLLLAGQIAFDVEEAGKNTDDFVHFLFGVDGMVIGYRDVETFDRAQSRSRAN